MVRSVLLDKNDVIAKCSLISLTWQTPHHMDFEFIFCLEYRGTFRTDILIASLIT